MTNYSLNKIIIILFFWLIAIASAQILTNAQTISFHKSYPLGSIAFSAIQTADSGYISAGKNQQNSIILKTDKKGIVQWFKSIETDNPVHRIYPVTPTLDNNYLVVYSIQKEINNEDIHLLKLDKLGDTLWTKTYGDSRREFAYSVHELSNRDVLIIFGIQELFAVKKVGLIRTNDMGELIWRKEFFLNKISGEPFHNILLSDGSLLITGQKKIVKFNADFDSLWAVETDFTIRSISASNDGSFIAAGLLIVKFDKEGIPEWTFNPGGEVICGNITSDKGFIFASTKVNITFLTKLDSVGSKLWERQMDSYYNSISQTNDDGYILAGIKNSTYTLTKTESTGSYRQLIITKPKGGEVYYPYDRVTITWDFVEVNSIDIYFSPDSGLTWTEIVKNFSAHWRQYIWKVPNILSDNYFIRIIDSDNPFIVDENFIPFKIVYNYALELVFPNGGEILATYSENVILWNCRSVEFVDIYLSTDNGLSWNVIISGYEAILQIFNWLFLVNSDSCLIKIVDSNDDSSFDISDSTFKVRIYQEYDFIAIKEVLMWVGNNGNGSHDPRTDGNGFYWPGGINATKSAIFQDGLLFGGKFNGEIRVNGNTHRQGMMPGILLEGNQPDDPFKTEYKVFKIRKNWELLPPGFERDKYEYDYNNWPGELGAPFIDNDHDGIYTKGIDEPKFIGDEVLYYVNHSNDSARSVFTYGSPPVALEFKTTVWGYNSDNWLKDGVFKKYRIINKTGSEIKDMYLSYWADDDLGDANDDFVGCDTTLNLAYTWNAKNNDGIYGTPTPAVGHMIVQSPLIKSVASDSARYQNGWIKGYKNLGMTSFAPIHKHISLINDFPFGIYEGTLQAYNIMQGLKNKGDSQIDPLTGEPTVYGLPGDPETGTGWYEGEGWSGGPFAGDRRYSINSGAFNMAPGDTQEIVIAIFMAQGSDHKNSVTQLKEKAKFFQKFYDTDMVTKVENERMVPLEFILYQNYPNPFNPTTKIKFSIPSAGSPLSRGARGVLVTLKVFDILGREVTTLINEQKSSGVYEVEFSVGSFGDGSNMASGVYFYQLRINDFVSTKKMVLLR
jgi:hypothetical protein